jgi:glycerate kinase
MKIIIAPDSYKESLTAMDVCNAIEEGFKQVYSDATYIKVPLGDGGEGTASLLTEACGGTFVSCKVHDPLGRVIEAFYGLSPDGSTAFIEMAAASGLHLLSPKERNPLITSTYGTGELILDAINAGVQKIILGLGGSATNDGGVGMAAALGVRFLNRKRSTISLNGGGLDELAYIDTSALDSRLASIKIEAACDVNNPLVGEKGASYIFAPQKGATSTMVEQLERNMRNYAYVLQECVQRDVNVAGAGAAGGMGAGVLAFLGGELVPGIDLVLSVSGIEKHMQEAELLITGEGRIDAQTIQGKTISGVATLAAQYGVPVVVIVGSADNNHQVVYKHGIDAVFSIVPGAMSLEEALQNAYENVTLTARNVAAVWKIAQQSLYKDN